MVGTYVVERLRPLTNKEELGGLLWREDISSVSADLLLGFEEKLFTPYFQRVEPRVVEMNFDLYSDPAD